MSNPSVPWPIAAPHELIEGGHLRFRTMVAFFLPKKFALHVDAARTLFDEWLSLAPPNALKSVMVGSNATGFKRANASSVDRCRAQLTAAAARKYAYFALGGAEWQFLVDGSVTDDLDVESGSTNMIAAWFPWNTPPDVVIAFGHRAAELLDYVTGAASLQLSFDNTGWKTASRLAAKHPGLELALQTSDLGQRCHGAHWLTFLGPTLVDTLGGRDAIMKQVAGIHIEHAGRGLSLRASERPELGNVTLGDIPSGLRRVAELLADITAPAKALLFETSDGADGDGESFKAFLGELGARWSRRFFEDGVALRALLEKLEVLDRLETNAAALIAGTDTNIDAFFDGLPSAPYLSKVLRTRLLQLFVVLVDRGETSAAARETFPLFALVEFAGFHMDLLLADGQTKAVEALLECVGRSKADITTRAIAIARLGEALTKVASSQVLGLARAIIAAMPPEADVKAWQRLLGDVNRRLGHLVYDGELEVAETLSDEIQPIAPHNPPIYLWTATIYVKRDRIDDAMGQLELAFKHGYDNLERIEKDPDFAPLLKHPRFAALGPATTVA